MNKSPKLYDKNYYKLFKEFKSFASQFTPEWHFDENSNDFGVTLAKIFCDMQENTINKLNKSINNIYLEFLNIIGVCKKIPKKAGEATKVIPNATKDNPNINKAIKSSKRRFSIVIDDLPSGFASSSST